jgi:hypothetical protein
MSNTKTVMSQAANTQGLPLDITDVFSTYLYTGTGAALTINNGIDLAGEGGLVWLKNRNTASNHSLHDTERTPSYQLVSNSTAAEDTSYGDLTSFNSDGFSLGTGGGGNNIANTSAIASWTFRKAPKFFDVVTYTGTGSAQNISHNLGSVPGMIVVKKTNSTGDWLVYHRQAHIGQTYQPLPERKYLNLNDTGSVSHGSGLMWGDTAPTDTVFSVSTDTQSNNNGDTYVAYLFAHNDGDGGFGPDSDQDIIKCGEVGIYDNTVNLGWEPQWILFKRTNGTSDWYIYDTMRGLTYNFNGVTSLLANTTAAETETGGITPITNGFISNLTGSYIYVAIRRGPLAPPESATEVFAIDTRASSGTNVEPAYRSPFPVDMAIVDRPVTSTSINRNVARLLGGTFLRTNDTTAAGAYTTVAFDNMNGISNAAFSSPDTNRVSWMWKRAPGYFDVVAYSGDGVAGRTVSHNLGVAPEMMWVKRRNSTGHWYVYHTGMTGGSDALHSTSRLNLAEAGFDTQSWKNYDFTDAHFSLDNGADINGSGGTYIAYLFASLPGISKVGSYTGNGSSQTIDCGFTSGARFVLSKCVSHTGAWYVFDTERGIVSGNDRVLELDSSNPEVSYPGIDPQSSGFIVNDNITNESGRTFIFYAIA